MFCKPVLMPFGFLKLVYLILCHLDFIYSNRKKCNLFFFFRLKQVIGSKENFLLELSKKDKTPSCL